MDHTTANADDLLDLTSKLHLAVAASEMGVWEFDASTGTVHWDDRMLEIYGLTDGLNRRRGDHWERFIHPDDLAETLAYAEKCRVENSDFRRDYRIVRQDGAVRYIRSMARNVLTEAGKVRLVGVNIDVTDHYMQAEELRKAQAQLRHEATHDALTGLGNRRRLDETTHAFFARVGDADEYCVMHLDLDHFKEVNDTLGHLAGDHVLQTLAKCLVRLVGNRGQCFRVGGDEFVVLFETAPPAQELKALCTQVLEAFSNPIRFGTELCSVSVSIGYTIARGVPRNPSDVFIDADAALYAAKYAGRATFRAYSEAMAASAECVATSRQDILGALDRDEIICLYQPQFDAASLSIVGAEALVRWDCPRRGLLTPDMFLPQAERVGLLPAIDARVFEIVAQQQTDWMQRGIPYPRISVNTSAERLRSDRLVEDVRERIASHHAISFELLETAFLDTLDTQLAATLSELRAMGLSIELDDFGSGHSSVAAMQAVKPDQVKIDRSLVAPLASNPAQIHTLQSLARIARLEGARIAIEGLETGMQLAAIRSVECDVLQGFALQRPMQTADFEARLVREAEPKAAQTA